MRRRNASRSRVPDGIAVGDRRHRDAVSRGCSREIAPSVATGQGFATAPRRYSRHLLPKINALTDLVQLEKLRSTKLLFPTCDYDRAPSPKLNPEKFGGFMETIAHVQRVSFSMIKNCTGLSGFISKHDECSFNHRVATSYATRYLHKPISRRQRINE